jgi:hypothetical protein
MQRHIQSSIAAIRSTIGIVGTANNPDRSAPETFAEDKFRLAVDARLCGMVLTDGAGMIAAVHDCLMPRTADARKEEIG